MIALIIRAAAALGVAVIGASSLIDEPISGSALVSYQTKCNLAQAYHDIELFRQTNGRMRFTDGEAWRPTFVAVEYAKRGMGIEHSLHTKRLARDKNLVIDGIVTMDSSKYAEAGKLWKEVGKIFGVDAAWGGDFKSVDAVHFSCAWEGVK